MPTVTLTNTTLRTLTITVSDAFSSSFVVNKTTADISLGTTTGVDADSVYVYWWNIGKSKSPQLLAINFTDCASPTFANVHELYDWIIDACNNTTGDIIEDANSLKVVKINGIDCSELTPTDINQTIKSAPVGGGGFKWVIA